MCIFFRWFDYNYYGMKTVCGIFPKVSCIHFAIRHACEGATVSMKICVKCSREDPICWLVFSKRGLSVTLMGDILVLRIWYDPCRSSTSCYSLRTYNRVYNADGYYLTPLFGRQELALKFSDYLQIESCFTKLYMLCMEPVLPSISNIAAFNICTCG